MIRKGLWLSLSLLLPATVGRAEPPPVAKPVVPEPVPVIKLTAQSAAAPSPALKYRLLPEMADLTPGNAALVYYRAYSPEWLTHRQQPDFDKKFEKWRPLKPRELPRKELAWVLTYKPLQELDRAARREYCDWELTSRIRQEGYAVLLPDMQGFRDMANLLSLRARLEMADGDHDRAVHTLQTGFALSRHLDRGPVVIIGLIGIAVANLMADQVETLIQSPDSPNLYWALTDLPRPLVDLRRPLQGEKLALQSIFPPVKQLEARALSPGEVQALMDRATHSLADLGLRLSPHSPEARIGLAALVAKSYSPAKRYLIDAGRDPALVEAMPAPQVVLLYSLVQYERLHDDIFKWINLPYGEAQPRLAKAEAAVGAARRSGEEGLPLASLLLPAVQQVALTKARLERRLAALRCIEAVRLYAAAHAGEPPPALKDITEVPVPVDPVTGKAFGYRVEEGRVHLAAPPPAGSEGISQYGLHYELTLK